MNSIEDITAQVKLRETLLRMVEHRLRDAYTALLIYEHMSSRAVYNIGGCPISIRGLAKGLAEVISDIEADRRFWEGLQHAYEDDVEALAELFNIPLEEAEKIVKLFRTAKELSQSNGGGAK